MILDTKNQMIELLMPLILFFISLAQKAGFVDGALLLLLNPKAYVIILLMFSHFLDGQSADNTQLIIVLHFHCGH